MIPELEWALEASQETVRFAAGLAYPSFEMDYEFVAITRPDEYAIYDGDILSSTGKKISPEVFEKSYIESHVQHSNALHSHTSDGNSYFVGPLARLNLNFEQLRPLARQAAEAIALYQGTFWKALACSTAGDLMTGRCASEFGYTTWRWMAFPSWWHITSRWENISPAWFMLLNCWNWILNGICPPPDDDDPGKLRAAFGCASINTRHAKNC